MYILDKFNCTKKKDICSRFYYHHKYSVLILAFMEEEVSGSHCIVNTLHRTAVLCISQSTDVIHFKMGLSLHRKCLC